MAALLEVEGLSKRYGTRWAVRELGFAVGEGEVVGFLGRNGAGKSTTIKMLCNLVRPTEGEARLDGESILARDRAAHRRRLGAVVEAPRFYPQLSGRRNLGLLARIYGVGPERVGTLLEAVGLSDRAEERFGRYSMGMKQRLGLAAVLLHRPRLIILDEPTSGLDPVGSRQIRALIADLVSRQGAGVLLSSHQLDEVEALCERALVIDEGRLIVEQSLRAAGGIRVIEETFHRLAHQREAR